ncbi:hypothetical protein V1506DRAFT_574791 [Lipomyces tetrasporus]
MGRTESMERTIEGMRHTLQRLRKPRAYFIGRSQAAADRILAECKALSPAGEYIFKKADVSLIRVVDEVCREIKAKEKVVNLLFLSQGVPSMDRNETSEHLHLLTALTYYSRLRFITNLLPTIQASTALRRIVYVAGGGNEGPLDHTDFPALRVPLAALRGHLCSLVTLGLEAVARTAPDVSFVHDYPGTVRTTLLSRMKGLRGVVIRTYAFVLGWWVCVPLEESGERHLYLATSARFPAAGKGVLSVPLGEGEEVAVGSTGEVGGGMYSVGWDGESASEGVRELLKGLRETGMVEEVWKHTEGEFKRITGGL